MIKALKERYQFARFCTVHRRSLAAQRTWQGAHLQKLIAYAFRYVPLWKKLLSEHGVSPDSIRTIDDIAKLPITSKQTFVGKVVEEYIDSTRLFPPWRWYTTSGTSGTPFTFLMSEHAMTEKYIDFGSLRFLWWRGESFGHIETIDFARIKIRARENQHRFFRSVEEYLKNPPDSLRSIAQFNAEMIGTYPSLLLNISKHIKSDPALRPSSLKYVMSFGERLTPSIRKEIESRLSCEVYDRYGLEEIGAVGVECARHDGFHLNTESVIAEILDDSGNLVPEGDSGRVVVTDLFNYSMPFIRYDSGDHGKISYQPCSCGLHSPRLWVEGRYSAYLTFPERRIHHLEFDAAMDTFMNAVLRYQIAKVSDDEIRARIIPGPSFTEDVSSRIEKKLRELVGPRLHIRVERVTELPITPRGKSRIVIDESASATI